MTRQSLIDTNAERGLELFNRGHFFDAHEALEDAWREVPRDLPSRRHFQGLVQLAVAFHHQSRSNFLGARSVLDRALRNLTGAEHSFPHLDLERLRQALAPWQKFLATEPPARGHRKPKLPRIVALKSNVPKETVPTKRSKRRPSRP